MLQVEVFICSNHNKATDYEHKEASQLESSVLLKRYAILLQKIVIRAWQVANKSCNIFITAHTSLNTQNAS